jgi:GTP pyrophosphokinase
MSDPSADIAEAAGGAVPVEEQIPASPEVEELIGELAEIHPDCDADRIRRAYAYAERAHREQMRHSGEPFISHPVGCARICVGLGLDDVAVTAALLHDTVEDTSSTLEEIEAEFGEEVAGLVDGVTKLSKIHFESREEHQAENYRKLIVAMSSDIRVLVVKLADRLHNMRTLAYMNKHKQIQKAKETLDIYAPLAHRLGIQSVKWELEDLAFATLHPRRYAEIQQLVAQRRQDRENYVAEAGDFLLRELERAGITNAQITGRAKHFYSIYEKMTRQGKEFNEIYDLTGMRVLVDSVKDCYGAVGIIHSLWKPMPGRFKDYVAMPKLNMYQSLHTTVIGPGGKPLEIQIRTHEMHRTAEYGVAAHWIYKERGRKGEGVDGWLSRVMDWERETPDPVEFMEALRNDLYLDEVYVFTPKGEVRNLAAGATPLDFAYEIHTDVGHRCVGAKVNGRIVPLTYTLKSGDFVEILTSKAPRGPSRDWLNLVKTSKARSKIRQFYKRERREDAEHRGREVIQEMGFRKAEDFYVSLGMGKTSVQTVVNKLMQRLKAGQSVAEEPAPDARQKRPQSASASSELGIEIDGLADVLVRVAKCCKPVPGDEIVGYISLGRGITIHRHDCPNARALMRNPERFTPVRWSGVPQQSFRVEVAVDASDRARLLEDLSRAFAECGANIVTAHCSVDDHLVHDRFVVDVGDVETLKTLIQHLRQVESVFDAYRVTPGA